MTALKKRLIWVAMLSILTVPWLPASAESGNEEEISIGSETSCISADCHTDIKEGRFVHEAASVGWLCVLCHLATEEGIHDFEIRGEGADLCFSCHDENRFKGSTLHGPVTDGKCMQCHHPHGSEYPGHLQAPQPDVCLGCHDREIRNATGTVLPATRALLNDENMNLHQPFAEGDCTVCHGAHPSNGYRRLKGNFPERFYASYANGTYSTCLQCHDDPEKPFLEPRTLNGTVFRNGNLNLHYRHVIGPKGRTCRTCHRHHGSVNPMLIRDSFRFGEKVFAIEYEKTDAGGGCNSVCHPPARYDRYEPVRNKMMTSPIPGREATVEELALTRELDMKRAGK